MINFGDAIIKISSNGTVIMKPGRKIATNFLKQHLSQSGANVGDSFTNNIINPIFIKRNPFFKNAAEIDNATPFECQLKPIFITNNPIFYQK